MPQSGHGTPPCASRAAPRPAGHGTWASSPSRTHQRGPCSLVSGGEHPAHTAQPSLTRRPSATTGACAAQ
eukprot:8733634-Alexandrium_andersonii.AAC.1